MGLDHISVTELLSTAMFTWLWKIVKVFGIKDSTFESYEGIFRNYIDGKKIGFNRIEDIQKVTLQTYYSRLYSESNLLFSSSTCSYIDAKNLRRG